MVSLLKHIINNDNRDYIIEKVNAPLVKAIVLLAGRYPEPTHLNVVHPNSHRLLNMEEKFFQCWSTNRSKSLYEAIWRILIVKYEHSPNWRYMLDWVIMMIPPDWKPFNPNRQMKCWRGD